MALVHTLSSEVAVERMNFAAGCLQFTFASVILERALLQCLTYVDYVHLEIVLAVTSNAINDAITRVWQERSTNLFAAIARCPNPAKSARRTLQKRFMYAHLFKAVWFGPASIQYTMGGKVRQGGAVHVQQHCQMTTVGQGGVSVRVVGFLSGCLFMFSAQKPHSYVCIYVYI